VRERGSMTLLLVLSGALRTFPRGDLASGRDLAVGRDDGIAGLELLAGFCLDGDVLALGGDAGGLESLRDGHASLEGDLLVDGASAERNDADGDFLFAHAVFSSWSGDLVEGSHQHLEQRGCCTSFPALRQPCCSRAGCQTADVDDAVFPTHGTYGFAGRVES